MITRFLSFALMLCFVSPSIGQSWKQLEKTADAYFKNGDYVKAASSYESAWKKKNRKELMFKIGETYFLLRDFKKAAEAYEVVKNDAADFPLVGLKYARSLKQTGRYDEAAKAFQRFRDSYTGEGKATIVEIVQTELKGCDLAKTLSPEPEVEITRPGNGINTSDNEFAPISIAPDILYFSSTMGGQARIYRSNYLGEAWGKSTTPPNFPLIQNGQYCHGTISPDETRLYFTICENKGQLDNLATRCEIFVIRKHEGGWSAPERLPDYINAAGVTATQPCVTHRGDVEILYFASNRSGGKGGMDIWYVTRNLNSDAGFSQPVNAGSINTMGHEMTPFYDTEEETLYFASTGLPSLGGFDLFKAKGDLTSWTTPENIGLPYNSLVDDMYLIKGKGGNSVFLSSNRMYGTDKTSTRDDDIFEFKLSPKSIMLEGAVFDKDLSELLSSYHLSLYEIQPDGRENLLLSRVFLDGNYVLDILPNRQYRVEVNAEGYESGEYAIFTNNPSVVTYGQPLFLKKVGGHPELSLPNPVKPAENPDTRPTNPSPSYPTVPEGSMYTLRGTSASDNLEYQSNAPRLQGVYYKIQLAASAKYNPAEYRYSKLSSLGSMQTEFIPSRNLTRILLADFVSVADVKKALAEVKKAGFTAAYIVKYENGVRYGKINL